MNNNIYKERLHYAYKYAARKEKQHSYIEFTERYSNDDICLAELWNTKHGDLKQCPKCDLHTKFYRVKGRKTYQCGRCQYNISPLANTIFHKSSTPLTMWFYALYLFSVNNDGISAKELERALGKGVTYKTAWRMVRKIKLLIYWNTKDLYSQKDETCKDFKQLLDYACREHKDDRSHKHIH